MTAHETDFELKRYSGRLLKLHEVSGFRKVDLNEADELVRPDFRCSHIR
jgi:hypothetical protein